MTPTEISPTLDLAQPAPPELVPDVEHLVTEDEAPVDNIFSEKQQRLLTESLYSSWDRSRFVVTANVGMFFAVSKPPYVPDVLLSVNVDVPADPWPKQNRSYFIWEYGKPPDAVIEIVSNRKGGEDAEKLLGYANIGIRYYVIFDPERLLSDEVLRAYQLVGMSYAPLPAPVWLPGIDLGLQLWQGEYEGLDASWLRWADGSGLVIPTGRERAEQERLRAERLAEQLRTLGVEPQE